MGSGTEFWAKAALLFCAAAGAYLLGCVNGAIFTSSVFCHDDVRRHGSGNAGLTNFYRTFGGPLTAVVILCDVVKAILALSVGVFLSQYWQPGLGVDAAAPDASYAALLFRYWSGLFCLLGHMFPCMFHFRGGKGILSGGTIAIMIDWRIALVVWGGFLILAVLTRYVSLGSLWAGASFPFATWYCYPDPVIVVLGFLLGGLVVWQHRGNLQRLLRGTESKFSFHHKKTEGQP